MGYEESKQLLLRDFKSLSNFEGVSFEMRGKKYSAAEMIKEIENETEIGMNLIQTHARTIEKIKEVKAKHPPKKKLWWQFWK